MYLATLPIDQALGHILRHNLADAQGRKTFSKGQRLNPGDLEGLRMLGMEQVRVAILEPGDLHEDAAAQRLASAVSGVGIRASRASHSRVNLFAAHDGVFHVDIAALTAINRIDGLTVATLATDRLVRTRQRLATIKIIPFAVPEQALVEAEAAGAGVVHVRPLMPMSVGVLLVGSQAAHQRIEQGVYPAIQSRIEELGSHVHCRQYVLPDEPVIAEQLRAMAHAGVELIITAGETSIMDRDDLIPQAIRMAGGTITHYGAPVEPGNLVLLADLGNLPILGAPGCVRSRNINIVDLLLPRLLTGERLTAEDIILLGHGGLL